MAQHPRVDLRVGYCSLRGAKATYDPEFTATVKWDIPLLEGYEWTEIPNQGSDSESFFGLCNFGVWNLVRDGQFDAIICLTGYIRASFWIAFFAAYDRHCFSLRNGRQQSRSAGFAFMEDFR
jgi:hypothetical protein